MLGGSERKVNTIAVFKDDKGKITEVRVIYRGGFRENLTDPGKIKDTLETFGDFMKTARFIEDFSEYVRTGTLTTYSVC